MATIHDVAKKAGVSVSTVSYAMSGSRPISAATRRRIMQAIEELNYHPNVLARGLASKRTKIIALLYPTVVSGYLDDIQLDFISSIANIASRHNYGLLLFTTPSGEQDILRFIKEKLIDGLILMEVEVHDRRVDLMNEFKFPFSLIGHCAENNGNSFVDLDFYTALRLCVEHLAGLGHREIAFLPKENHAEMVNTYIAESERGFLETTARLGLRGVLHGVCPTVEDAHTVMCRLLVENPNLTAVISGNDPIYTGVVDALQEKGLRIPADFSTVGMISHQMAEKYTPKVTSLTIPSHEMGRMGAEFLIRKLDGQETQPQQVILSPKLTIRHSSGPCPLGKSGQSSAVGANQSDLIG